MAIGWDIHEAGVWLITLADDFVLGRSLSRLLILASYYSGHNFFPYI
jgi:hypothetical protein